jgi:hypothetical protein
MTSRQAVVYVARNVQEAYLLRNRLAEDRISSVVTNELLEGGRGVDVLGWATSARVVVREDDAQRARVIALAFDREVTDAAKKPRPPEPDAPAPDAPEQWPTCPQCHAPRLTRCPCCQTAGISFPAADAPPTAVEMSAEQAAAVDVFDPAASGTSCACGSGGCTPTRAEEEQTASELPPERPMLLCPICDEAFTPQYGRRCEWCGHEFADGMTFEPPAREQIHARVLIVILLLLAFVGAVVAYFALLF